MCVPGCALTSTRTVPQKLAAALTPCTRSHPSISPSWGSFPWRVEPQTGIPSKDAQTFPVTVMWRDVNATHTCFCHLFIFLRQTQRLLFLVRHGAFWPLCTCHSRLFQPVRSAAWNRKMPLFYIYIFSDCANFPTEWTNVCPSRIQTLNCTIIVPTETPGSTCALDSKTTTALPRLNEVV